MRLSTCSKSTAEQDSAVERIARASDRISCGWIHLDRIRRIIKSRVEGADVIPKAIEGLHDGVTYAIVKMKLRTDLERVLREEVVKVGAVRRLRSGANFGITGEQTERGIGSIKSGANRISARKFELAVLIVGLSGNSVLSGDLIIIIRCRPFVEHTCAYSVIADDTSDSIGKVHHESLRMGGVGATVQGRDATVIKLYGRNLIRKVFPIRKEEWVVDPIPCAVVETGGRIDAQAIRSVADS